MATDPSTPVRWPGVRVVLASSLVAAAAVAIDTYYSAQEGYLALPPDYEGIGYLQFARTAYLLIRHLHLRTALHEMNSIAPLWTSLQTLQYLVVGDGTWQAFTVRFWPVALLLILVYWIVRNRATTALAVSAVALTAILPMVSAGVRASSWEFFSGHASYAENWGLDDLRPDFLALVFTVCSIASLAEHEGSRRRSAYWVSGAFVAAAVLTKPSTATFAVLAWALVLSLILVWHREAWTLRMTAESVGVLILLLIPWGIAGRGFEATIARLYEASVQYSSAYSAATDLPQRLTYYLVRLPSQIGQVEVTFVVLGSVLMAAGPLRRLLTHAELIYGVTIVFFYVAFTLPANKDPNIGEYVSLSFWIFFLAAGSRLVMTRWPSTIIRRASPALLAGVGVYVLLAYALGLIALANWPTPERMTHQQQNVITGEVAQELNRHLVAGECFGYAPGPGWPALLEVLMMDGNGAAPYNSPIDVDPKTTTTSDYIAVASQCPAILSYREDPTEVAKAFECPPVRQPYLRALASFVRDPANGYRLDRSWTFDHLPPSGPYTLGHYQGVSLTVDLYLKGGAAGTAA